MPTHERHRPRGVRPTLLGIATLAALSAAGCRTYEPAPIDLDRVDRAFTERSIDPTSTATEGDAIVLDLATAEAACLLFNADLRVRRADAGVAEAAADWAGLWPDPVVGLDLTRLLASVSNPLELLGSVGFTLPVSGRLEVEKSRLGRDHARMLVELEVLEWRTRLAVRDAWYRWSAAETERATTAAYIDAIDELLRLVDAMETTGDLSRVEARIFRLARLDAQVTLTELDTTLETSRLDLLRLIGLPPTACVSFAPVTMTITNAAAESEDLRDAPDVRMALASHEVAEAALELAVRGQYPDLGLAPGYGTRDGYRQIGLGISIPIPIFNANRQAIETALAARTAAAVAVERAYERTATSLAAARATLDLASRRRQLVENDLLPLVETQFHEIRTLADLGQIDTLVLLDAFSRRRDATIDLAQARRDEAYAINRMHSIAGPTTPAATTSTPTSGDAS